MPKTEILSSRQFPDWLTQHRLSFALTTYQTGQLFFLGTHNAQLSGFQRLYDRAMGLHATPDRLYLSCKYQIWQLDNTLEPGEFYKEYDKLYVPRIGYTTGDLDIHDIAVDQEGQIIFVSTHLNCLATVSDRRSCKPLWKPSFISRIINEDRCHLNGLAMVDGRPSYVSACSRSDIVDGWRDRRIGGGIIIDVASNEIVCTGLSMPHSPRWYQGKLWVLNSGEGELGYVNLETGQFEAVAFCPGYLRGLAFWQNYAILGLSKPRGGDQTFSGLPLDDHLQAKDADARCGLMVVDLETGAIAQWVRFEGQITELYDVQVLPSIKRPMALGFQTEEIAQLISLEPLQEDRKSSVAIKPSALGHSTQPTASVTPVSVAFFERLHGTAVQQMGYPSQSLSRSLESAGIQPAPGQKTLPAVEPANTVEQQDEPNSRAATLLKQSRRLKRANRLIEAEVCLREAIALQPNLWGAHNNLGTLLQNRGDLAEAKACYEKAIAANPNFAQAISNLASIWQLKERIEPAKTGFMRALELNPNYLPAHFNLGTIYKRQTRMPQAIEHFQKVIQLDPSYTNAYFSLGQIFEYQDQATDALTCYQTVQELDPSRIHIASYISLVQRRLCQWQNYEAQVNTLKAALDETLADPSLHGFNSFVLNSFPIPQEKQLAAAQRQSQTIVQMVAETKQKLNFKHFPPLVPPEAELHPLVPPCRGRPEEVPPFAKGRAGVGGKLRVGYISPDFREHAVGRLIKNLFPYHDRTQFEIYAYSTVEVNDTITQTVRSGCDQFVDLTAFSTEAAAQRIYDDGIHILIDLAGFTIGNGAEILALQPAPLQAQWLGYPNTMGAEFIQYYLGDRTLITSDLAQYYAEEIVYLPHAFVASPLEISKKTMRRSEHGLPEDAFVFCCFNAHYKITPDLFAGWLRILDQMPNSVLWLSSGQGIENLRLEAQQKGCDPDRLIFADKRPHDEYLARYALADLYLDTWIYTAGSTAAAVLWSGLPLLTCLGETNASRMGASICRAAGLEEMICETSANYEQRAIYLATHPEELKQIRQRLQNSLIEPATYPPLFQVEEFVRSLESAFQAMWNKSGSSDPRVLR